MISLGINICIDHCSAAICSHEEIFPVKLDGSLFVPSIIYIDHMGKYIVGIKAKQHVAVHPNQCIISLFRDIGTSTIYNINDKVFNTTEAVTAILVYIKCETEKIFKEKISHVLITVPFYFGFKEIEKVRKAAVCAGLKPLSIIPESIAITGRCAMETHNRQSICAINFRNGTFDVTVLDVDCNKKLNNPIVNIINSNGDYSINIDDFDNIIIDWMIQNGAKEYKNKSRLKYDAESARIDLAVLTETVVDSVYMPNPVVLHRYKYKELIQSKLDRIGEIIKNTVGNSIIDGSRIDMNDINHFILVGDACKHSIIRDYILKIVKREAFMVSYMNDYSVAEESALLSYCYNKVRIGTIKNTENKYSFF